MEMSNGDEEWTKFKEKYMQLKLDIAMEILTSDEYTTRVLRDIKFSLKYILNLLTALWSSVMALYNIENFSKRYSRA